MYQVEEDHWWYVGLHHLVLLLLSQQHFCHDGFEILDAGCGTGKLLVRLGALLGTSIGMDIAPDAIEFTLMRKVNLLVRGSICEMSFRSDIFGIVISLDVASYMEVDDVRRAFAEMHRTLRPGGQLILNLPAYQCLRSSHDLALGMRHRFNKLELRSMLQDAGFTVDLCTYRNTLLFPVAAVVRILRRLSLKRRDIIRSDLKPVPAPINYMLSRLLFLENHLIRRRISLPVGLSLFSLARKQI